MYEYVEPNDSDLAGIVHRATVFPCEGGYKVVRDGIFSPVFASLEEAKQDAERTAKISVYGAKAMLMGTRP